MKRLALLILSGCFPLFACTTLSEMRSSKPTSSSQLTFDKDPIVLQASGRTILHKLDRDTWVDIRKSSKDEYTRLYAALGAAEWDVAINDSRLYLQSHPRDEVALTVLSIGLAMKKNFSLAAYYAKLLNEAHPGNPEVNNIFGLAIMNKPGANMSDYRAAMHHFQLAFDASSQQVASGLNLAYLHLEMGNAAAARDVYQAVSSRCNGCTEAQLGVGIALSRLGTYEKAEDAFQSVMAKEPHNPYARYYLALVAKYGRNDNKGAINQLTALMEDKDINNVEMQRKANFLLRRIQAQVYGQAKDSQMADVKVNGQQMTPTPTNSVNQPSGEDLEQILNAE